MESTSPVITDLVQRLLQLKAETETDTETQTQTQTAGSPHSQVWVSISRAPGSGKSTLAHLLAQVLPGAVVIPMDGFHFYKSHLSAMPDPQLAFARRGAAWTFDASKFVATLKAARQAREGVFPSFDHAVGDPVEDDIRVSPTHQFVIVEGLYLLLSSEPWRQVRDVVDLSVFVQADDAVLKARLVRRHMACFGMSEEDAAHRAEGNDLPNAVDIINDKERADVIVDNNTTTSNGNSNSNSNI